MRILTTCADLFTIAQYSNALISLPPPHSLKIFTYGGGAAP